MQRKESTLRKRGDNKTDSSNTVVKSIIYYQQLYVDRYRSSCHQLIRELKSNDKSSDEYQKSINSI